MRKYKFIYKITNVLNGKIYVGKRTTDIIEDGYLGSGIKINNSIKKYGREYFKREILEFCETKEELNEREIFWIKELNSRDKNIGYNIAKGGDGGPYTLDGKAWNSGKKMSPEYCEKNRRGHIGKKASKETRAKMSESQKGKIISEEHKDILRQRMTGREVSQETKDKIRDINLGKKRSNESIQKNIDFLTGRPRSEQTKEKIRNTLTGRKRDKSIFIKAVETRRRNQGGVLKSWNAGKTMPEYICSNCGKIGRGGAMKRYHFENCKQKK